MSYKKHFYGLSRFCWGGNLVFKYRWWYSIWVRSILARIRAPQFSFLLLKKILGACTKGLWSDPTSIYPTFFLYLMAFGMLLSRNWCLLSYFLNVQLLAPYSSESPIAWWSLKCFGSLTLTVCSFLCKCIFYK